MFKIENGATVQDKVTGFKGIVTGRADYISGCNQYLVQPVMTKEFVEAKWFDELRLRTLPPPNIVINKRKERTGADGVAPIK